MGGGWNNAFYDSANQYGGQSLGGGSMDWYNTDAVKYFFSPSSAEKGTFLRYLQGQGSGGFDRKSLFGQSLFGRTGQGYEAAQQSNPDLLYRDYLNSLGPSFVDNIWKGLTPEQRGESPARFSSPVRWMSRG
jgi:hypothetical protein